MWSCLLLSIEYKWRSWPEERRAKCTTPALFKWGKNNCNVTSAAYHWWYSASKKIPSSLPSLFYCCFQEKEIHFLTQIYPLPLLLLLQNFLLFSLQRALYSSRKNCIEVWWLMKGDGGKFSTKTLLSSKVLLHYEFPLQTLNNFSSNLRKKPRRHKISVASDAFLEGMRMDVHDADALAINHFIGMYYYLQRESGKKKYACRAAGRAFPATASNFGLSDNFCRHRVTESFPSNFPPCERAGPSGCAFNFTLWQYRLILFNATNFAPLVAFRVGHAKWPHLPRNRDLFRRMKEVIARYFDSSICCLLFLKSLYNFDHHFAK